jgi:DNA-binding HxlR family transcriptional regulator
MVDERRLQQIQDLVRYKWNLAVLIHLNECPHRYMELVGVVRLDGKPISEKMLRQTLERLRASGAARQVPVDDRVSAYALTAWGQRVASTLVSLMDNDGAQLD